MTTLQHIRGFLIWLASMLVIIGLLVVLTIYCTSCARTVAYHDNGKPALRTEADVTNLKFAKHVDGSFELSGDFNHSAATTAQGNAASAKLTAIGSAIAAAGAAVFLR